MKWITRFSVDDGTTWSEKLPDWVTVFTSSGNGNSTSASMRYNVSVSTQTGQIHNPHNIKLRATPSIQGVTDLSVRSGKVNTANCYIVNAPGKYSFPLVYGNAIKNSVANTSAYSSENNGNNVILQKFVNHLGNEITSPYIY